MTATSGYLQHICIYKTLKQFVITILNLCCHFTYNNSYISSRQPPGQPCSRVRLSWLTCSVSLSPRCERSELVLWLQRCMTLGLKGRLAPKGLTRSPHLPSESLPVVFGGWSKSPVAGKSWAGAGRSSSDKSQFNVVKIMDAIMSGKSS